MADDQSSPGLFGRAQPEPDYAGPKPTGNPVDDYLTTRQAARFQATINEVNGMLKANPVGGDVDWGKARRDLRQKGYDRKEEDAIMNVFIKQHGARQGTMEAQRLMPSYGEGQTVPSYSGAPDEPGQPPNPQVKDIEGKFPIGGLPEPTPYGAAILAPKNLPGQKTMTPSQRLQQLYEMDKKRGIKAGADT